MRQDFARVKVGASNCSLTICVFMLIYSGKLKKENLTKIYTKKKKLLFCPDQKIERKEKKNPID